jgi:hypothetical protein
MPITYLTLKQACILIVFWEIEIHFFAISLIMGLCFHGVNGILFQIPIHHAVTDTKNGHSFIEEIGYLLPKPLICQSIWTEIGF